MSLSEDGRINIMRLTGNRLAVGKNKKFQN